MKRTKDRRLELYEQISHEETLAEHLLNASIPALKKELKSLNPPKRELQEYDIELD